MPRQMENRPFRAVISGYLLTYCEFPEIIWQLLHLTAII